MWQWLRRLVRRLRRGLRRSRIRYRYRSLTRQGIAQGIGPHQTQLLRDFFGQGVEGAEARMRDFRIPEGLSRETLERYLEIARRTIEEGLDTSGVQQRRNELVERALDAIR